MYIVYNKTTGEISYSVEENAIDVFVDPTDAILEIDKHIKINEYYVERNQLKKKKDVRMEVEGNILRLFCDENIGEITLKIINKNRIINTLNLNIPTVKEEIEIEKTDNDQYQIILEGFRVIQKEITL